MDNCDHVVDVGAVSRGVRRSFAPGRAPQHGEAGVTRPLGHPQQIRHVVVGVERDHLNPGCHDILRGALTQP